MTLSAVNSHLINVRISTQKSGISLIENAPINGDKQMINYATELFKLKH